jgi:hypothetical protein
MTANEDANPEIAPKELASGRHIPRVKRPSRGPPTIPKTERAAFRKFLEGIFFKQAYSIVGKGQNAIVKLRVNFELRS